MTKSALLLIASTLFLSLAKAGPNCSVVFEVRQTSRLQISFGSGFPVHQQRLVSEVVQKVQEFYGDLELPPNIRFSYGPHEWYEVAGADYITESIFLTPSSSQLTDNAFRAILAHELTHFVVARNLRMNTGTIRESLLKKADDVFAQVAIGNREGPYAELFCDTMAVLVTGDLKAMVNAMSELKEIAKTNVNLQKALERSLRDHPQEFSVRDFSISHTDARWEKYNPADSNYNRFNQIRAYLGSKIASISYSERKLFFVKLMNALNPIFQGERLDQLMMFNGVGESNKALIEYLEGEL